MRQVFIMDALARVKAHKDTTYFLMRAAHERGHQVGHIEPRELWLHHDQLRGAVQWLDVHAEPRRPFTPRARDDIALGECDAVWLRTDPPFDRRYFYVTLLLDRLPAAVCIINRPSGLRNWNEKLAALEFAHYAPPMIVTSSPTQLDAFARHHPRITLKPLDGYAGRGIVFYQAGDDPEVLQAATADGAHLIVAQAYLPAARDGDKRILLLDGEPLGAILRVHAEGEEINNLDAGGSAHPSELSARDLEICAALKPALRAQGVFFAGIDVIGDRLIEVNVTSPTGLQELCKFSGEAHHHRIITALESRVQSMR